MKKKVLFICTHNSARSQMAEVFLNLLFPEKYERYIDQGEQTFTYMLLPHRGSWKDAGTVKLAESLNTSPIAFIEYNHKGLLPQEKSFIKVDKENIIVSATKEAEDMEDLIVRAYETKQEATKVNIILFNRSWQASFSPCEIKTFLIPRDESLPIKEVNLLEEG